MSGFEWARPFGLGALALPLVLLVVARVLEKPRPRAIGTLELWRRVVTDPVAVRGRARPRIPPAIWVLAGALVLAALALAGPRATTPTTPRTWTLVVDRSAGMYLPLREGETETRLERALALARDELARSAANDDRVRWVSPGRGALLLATGEEPPAEWFAPGSVPAARPAFDALDVPGALWITDGAREAERAGVFASGGDVAPGFVGRRGAERLEWDGERVRAADAAPRPVEVRGDPGRVLGALIEAWCEARGFEARAPGEGESPALRIDAPPAGSAGEAGQVQVAGVELEVDGRRALTLASARATLGPADAPLAVAALGEVQLAVRCDVPPTGDLAPCAVAVARLLDGAVSPEPDAVPIELRRAPGAEYVNPGDPPVRAEPVSEPLQLEAGLAGGAALLALVALGVLAADGARARRATS